jgi:hypothetical protein
VKGLLRTPTTTSMSQPFQSSSATLSLILLQRRHMDSHTHPTQCPHGGRGFEHKKDVDRNINDRHNTTTRYYCTFQNCKLSLRIGKGFPRKDNCKRHMRHIHGIVDDMNLVRLASADQLTDQFLNFNGPLREQGFHW